MTETGELTYRRVHRASPELLFDCMTTPEHLTHFWGPVGTTTPVGNITVDLRPGGAFETTMVNDADGSTYTMRAVYVEVRRPERLVWIEPDVEGGMRTTITFVDLHDGRTEVVTHQTNVPAAYLSAEARAGFTHQPRPLRRLRGRSEHPQNTSTSKEHEMPTVTSADGTTIAYERTGSGPALVLVDGAMCYRGAGPMRPLAALLQDAFTVYTYDRRGRGESSDTCRTRSPARSRTCRPSSRRPVARHTSTASPPARRSPWRPRPPAPGSQSWRSTSHRSWPRSRTAPGSRSTPNDSTSCSTPGARATPWHCS